VDRGRALRLLGRPHVLSEDVEDPWMAAPREIRELRERVLERLPGDVPRREAPHDRAGDVRQAGEDELLEHRRGRGRGFYPRRGCVPWPRERPPRACRVNARIVLTTAPD